MLKSEYTPDLIECGCDEAGRGSLAGAVFAAAVVLPKGYKHEGLNDSKKLTERERYRLREDIERDAVAWAVAQVDAEEIDKRNILGPTMNERNLAVGKWSVVPELLILYGNRF